MSIPMLERIKNHVNEFNPFILPNSCIIDTDASVIRSARKEKAPVLRHTLRFGPANSAKLSLVCNYFHYYMNLRRDKELENYDFRFFIRLCPG